MTGDSQSTIGKTEYQSSKGKTVRKTYDRRTHNLRGDYLHNCTPIHPLVQHLQRHMEGDDMGIAGTYLVS